MSIHDFPKNLRRSAALGGALLLLAPGCGGKDGAEEVKPTAAPLHIHRFSVHPSTIRPGQTAILQADFTAGKAEVTPGVGAVTPGAPVLVSPAKTTTFHLKVKADSGREAERTVTLKVQDTP